MINPKRGDVTIPLVHPVTGEPYPLTLRPSFEAIAAIEGRSAPQSIFRLLAGLVERRDLSVSMAAAIVWAGVNAARKDEGDASRQITYEHAGAALMATPVDRWLPVVLEFLTNCTSTPESRKQAGADLGNAAGGV
jgi:hypothetical protein